MILRLLRRLRLLLLWLLLWLLLRPGCGHTHDGNDQSYTVKDEPVVEAAELGRIEMGKRRSVWQPLVQLHQANVLENEERH